MASTLYKVQHKDYNDQWNIARIEDGTLNLDLMKKHFKYIPTGHSIQEWIRMRKLLTENIKPDLSSGLVPYITLGENVYFLNEEDYHLINGLLYITPLKPED
jgi:hypothetical protein